MYYLFYGDDAPAARSAALKEVLVHTNGQHTYTTLTDEIVEGALSDMLGATSLFFEKEVYMLDTLSRNNELFESLLLMLPELKESPNIFILIEEKVGIKEGKTLLKYARESKQFEKKPGKEFNVFSLTDALLMRDKKSLWILLNDAWRAGKSSEEIIGTLHWQLKSVRVAGKVSNAEAAGLKPFVYDKAKRAYAKYSEAEISDRSHTLVSLYHEGHAGKGDIDRALERWVLSL